MILIMLVFYVDMLPAMAYHKHKEYVKWIDGMKYSRILTILSVAVVLSLLLVVIPSKPALAAPLLTLSPNTGAVGTSVTITGTNFGSYVGDSLSIFFNNVEIADSPKTVPATGTFEARFDVPGNAPPGNAWVTVKGPIDSILARAPFLVREAEIRLDVYEGSIGTPVTVTGEGFYADQTVVFYYSHDGLKEKLTTETAGPVGECRSQFTIPPSSAGKQKIIVESPQGQSATADFRVIPSAALSVSSGTTGDIVTVTGTGFSSGSEISVYLTTRKVAYANTNQYGSFQGTFRVLAINSGVYDVRVQDEDGNAYKLQFAIVSDTNINTTTGNVGTELIISGSGFIASETVTVMYDDLEVASTTVDSKGAFSVTFDVPASDAGSHVITVSDGTNTREFDFTMESEPPPAPAPVPVTDVTAESTLQLQWEDVDDLSLPVSYDLQVASDEDFASITLEKQGLTESEYTLTQGEMLKPTRKTTPYYWRVKATDSAANESEWSTPESFDVISGSALPTWGIILLALFGVLVIGFLVFRLSRRRTYDDDF